METELDPLLREKEAAELLATPIRTVQDWRTRGTGPPFVRTGRRGVRYRRSDILRWLLERTRMSTADRLAPREEGRP